MSECIPTKDAYKVQSDVPCHPHTGLDLGPIAGIGLALIIVGAVIFRKSSFSESNNDST